MNYIEAPNKFNGNSKSIFLAGGITNCFNWQKEMSEKLRDLSITILNPRPEKIEIVFSLEELVDQIQNNF